MYRIIFTTFLLAKATLLPGSLADCEPDCSGHVQGDKVEDPKDCTRYYICISSELPTDSTVPCPPAHVFDPSKGDCVPGPSCTPSCVPPVCDMTCSSEGDLISDPLDCSVYYECANGSIAGGAFTCPSDQPYFDGENCTSDEATCCGDLCTPYCHPGDIQIPDPVDCTAFYVCLVEGLADEEYHYKCPNNELFDVVLGKCREMMECVILCHKGKSGHYKAAKRPTPPSADEY